LGRTLDPVYVGINTVHRSNSPLEEDNPMQRTGFVVCLQLLHARDRADAQVTQAEDDFFDRMLNQMHCTDEERVLARQPVDDAAVHETLSVLSHPVRVGLFKTLIKAARVDGHVDDREASFIAQLGHAVGLDDATINALWSPPTSTAVSQHDPRFEALCEAARSQIVECDVGDVNTWRPSDDIVILDVREASEYAVDHLPGAIHLSRGVLERDVHTLELADDARVVLYCGGGYRSALAAQSLSAMGYRNVRSMRDGIKAWRAAGLASSLQRIKSRWLPSPDSVALYA